MITDDTPQIEAPTGLPADHGRPEGGPARRRGPSRRSRLAVALAVTFVAATAAMVWAMEGKGPEVMRRSTPVTAAELQDRFGIQIDMVAVSAAGGMVDFRYTVTDASKAVALQDEPDMPLLVAEGSDLVVDVGGGMSHHSHLKDGGTYFMLFPNPAGVIQPGTHVSVVIGDVRLDDLVAKS